MKPTSPKIIATLACAIYLIFGMFNGAIGPVLGELANQTSSSLSAIGGVLTFLFLGALIAQLTAGPLTDKFGQKMVLVVSLCLLAIGIIGFTTAKNLTIMYAIMLFTGLGQGGVDLGANLVVANAFPKNNNSALNLLHFFFGLGAFFGPALVSLAIGATDSGLSVHWAAAVLLVVLAGLTLLTSSSKPPVSIDMESRSVTTNKSVYTSPLLWTICIMVLLYVGVEYGLGSWSTAFMNQTISMPIQSAALVTSAYWGFLTLGRLAGAIVSRKLSKLQQLGYALLGSAISGVAFAFLTGTKSPVIIAMVMIGFFLGTILPTIISVTTSAFPLHQGKAVGIVTAMGSVGGLGIPWIAGLLLEKVSAVGYAAFIAIILSVLGLLFFLVRLLLKNHVIIKV